MAKARESSNKYGQLAIAPATDAKKIRCRLNTSPQAAVRAPVEPISLPCYRGKRSGILRNEVEMMSQRGVGMQRKLVWALSPLLWLAGSGVARADDEPIVDKL